MSGAEPQGGPPGVRVLVTGAAGQLGAALLRLSWPAGVTVAGFDRAGLDLADPDAPTVVVERFRPDVVINAAAFTDVDRAEREEELAFRVNRDGAERLAGAAAGVGAAILHVSTDFVFEGGKGAPYDEEDAPGPVNTYGRSKAAGEEAVRRANPRHLVVRTSWVHAPVGRNFVTSVLRWAAERETLEATVDQFGNPTAAADLAEGLARLALQVASRDEAPWGILHLAGAGGASRFEVAAHVLARLEQAGGARRRLAGVGADRFPLPARRPADTRLATGRALRDFGVALPPWREGLDRTLAVLLAPPADSEGTVR